MAFTKSDGTAGSFDENGNPLDNRNDGQSIQGVDSKLGSNSDNAQDGTDTSAAAFIEGVNVPHSNAPATDNRAKKARTAMVNSAIAQGLPAYNAYTGKFAKGPKGPATGAGGVSRAIDGEDISEDIGDTDTSLVAEFSNSRLRRFVLPLGPRKILDPWQWNADPHWGHVPEAIYRIIMGSPAPSYLPPGSRRPEINPCGNLREDCYKSDLCHDSGVYCGVSGIERHIYQGQLGPYSGYWYEAGNIRVISEWSQNQSGQPTQGYDAEEWFNNDPFGCCNSSGKVQSLDGYRTNWVDIFGTYGQHSSTPDSTACAHAVTGYVGNKKAWKHSLIFVDPALTDASGATSNPYACQGYLNFPNPTGFRADFFEPNDCGSGSGSADLVGCYLGVLGELTKVNTFMVGTPEDPCFCAYYQSGYGGGSRQWYNDHPHQGELRLDQRTAFIFNCKSPNVLPEADTFGHFGGNPADPTAKDAWVQCVWTGTCSGTEGPFVMGTGDGGGVVTPIGDSCTPKRWLQPTSPASIDAINCFKTACDTKGLGYHITPRHNQNTGPLKVQNVDLWANDQFRCVDTNTGNWSVCEEQYIFNAHGAHVSTANTALSGNTLADGQAIALLGCCIDTSGYDTTDCQELLVQTSGATSGYIFPTLQTEAIGAWVSYTGYAGTGIGGTGLPAGDRNWYAWNRRWEGDPYGANSGSCHDPDGTGGAPPDCRWVYQLAHYDCVTDDSASYYSTLDFTGVRQVQGSRPDIDDLQMRGVDTGTSFSAYVERCEFQYPPVNAFSDCGSCYTGIPLYETGVLVFWTGQTPPNTGKNYRINSITQTGQDYGDSGCGFTYDLTFMCSGIEVGPTQSDIPEAAIAPTGLTSDCGIGGGGGCTGKCIYVWENHHTGFGRETTWMWRLLPNNTCNCTCGYPGRDGTFDGERLEGTCS